MTSRHTATPLPRKRWEYLKSLAPHARLLHDSSRLGTLKLGRNKAKRDLRGQRNAWVGGAR